MSLLYLFQERYNRPCCTSCRIDSMDNPGDQFDRSASGKARAVAAARARTLGDEALSNWSPGLSMLSMRHEAQHGRLYRS
jgi:hypothetical protein